MSAADVLGVVVLVAAFALVAYFAWDTLKHAALEEEDDGSQA